MFRLVWYWPLPPSLLCFMTFSAEARQLPRSDKHIPCDIAVVGAGAVPNVDFCPSEQGCLVIHGDPGGATLQWWNDCNISTYLSIFKENMGLYIPAYLAFEKSWKIMFRFHCRLLINKNKSWASHGPCRRQRDGARSSMIIERWEFDGPMGFCWKKNRTWARFWTCIKHHHTVFISYLHICAGLNIVEHPCTIAKFWRSTSHSFDPKSQHFWQMLEM